MKMRFFDALYKDLGKSAYEVYETEIGLVYSEITYMLKHLDRLARPKRVATPLFQFSVKEFDLQRTIRFGTDHVAVELSVPADFGSFGRRPGGRQLRGGQTFQLIRRPFPTSSLKSSVRHSANVTCIR